MLGLLFLLLFFFGVGGLIAVLSLPRVGVSFGGQGARGAPHVRRGGAPGRLPAKQLDGQPLETKKQYAVVSGGSQL